LSNNIENIKRGRSIDSKGYIYELKWRKMEFIGALFSDILLAQYIPGKFKAQHVGSDKMVTE